MKSHLKYISIAALLVVLSMTDTNAATITLDGTTVPDLATAMGQAITGDTIAVTASSVKTGTLAASYSQAVNINGPASGVDTLTFGGTNNITDGSILQFANGGHVDHLYLGQQGALTIASANDGQWNTVSVDDLNTDGTGIRTKF